MFYLLTRNSTKLEVMHSEMEKWLEKNKNFIVRNLLMHFLSKVGFIVYKKAKCQYHKYFESAFIVFTTKILMWIVNSHMFAF